MASFLDFCRRTASHNDAVPATSDTTLSEELKKRVDVLVNLMKNKLEIVDRVTIPFIEATFDGDVISALDSKTEDGEVPDELINALSEKLYEKEFEQLSDDERSIINVLSCYIMLQN